MKGMQELRYRNFNITVNAIDADNWSWKVKRADGSTLAKCEDDELEADEEMAIQAAKEAIDDWHDDEN